MPGRPALSILAGSDLHYSQAGWAWFLAMAQARQPDCIAFLGDFVNRQPIEFIKQALKDLHGLARYVLVIPGNWDPRAALVEFDLHAHDGLRNLHKASAYLDGYIVAGLGGSTTTPVGDTPLEGPEDGFATPLASLLPAEVWLLHNPLRGFRDRTGHGSHVGSTALRELWEAQDVKPRLVLSGHIHEAHGIDEQAGTIFVNPGSLKELRAAWIELTDSSAQGTLLEG
jgi:uncharacterized protein